MLFRSRGSRRGAKGADRGVDGVITFIDDARSKPKRVLVQVKSGSVYSRDVRDLRGTVEREDAAIGVLITLEPPTSAMEQEAVTAGFYPELMASLLWPEIQAHRAEVLPLDEEGLHEDRRPQVDRKSVV